MVNKQRNGTNEAGNVGAFKIYKAMNDRFIR